MLAIFLKTLPFFALAGLGFAAVRLRLFSAEGTAWLTHFVFFFPLSALLFGFAARISPAALFDGPLAAAFLAAGAALYAIVAGVALLRGGSVGEAAIEAQCAVIGNTGFFGIPLVTLLIGAEAVPPMLLLLMIDVVVFSAVITVIVIASRERIRPATLLSAGRGLLGNPMIVAIAAGFAWSATGLPLPGPAAEFVAMLAGAATPAALFAIGASLAGRSAERLGVAIWLSVAKLLLMPALCLAAAWVAGLPPLSRSMIVIYAAMPVAGNVYMLAAHYGLAPKRVSSAILVSTAASVLTLPPILHWALPGALP